MARRGIRPGRTARLTPRGYGLGIVGVASVLGAYAAGRSELLYLGLLLVLLPAIAIAFARYRRLDITASRTFDPAAVPVAHPTSVDLTVTNQTYTPTPRLAWRDYRPWSAGGSYPGSLPPLASKRAGSSANSTRLRYPLVPPRRGVFEIGPMTVVLADPFSLATGEVVVGGTDGLIVTPRIPTLADHGLAILASEGSSMLVRRALGGEDDLSTREYRTGDALRRVHWRATARHGELMVRQEEPRSHAEARIIIDTRRSGYADFVPSRRGETIESDSFELAISIASSIALHLSRSGFQAELVETAAPQLAPVSPIEPFLRSLALVDLSVETGSIRSSPLAASSRPDEAHGSVFAVIADADADTVERLIVQRQSFDLAVAFVLCWRSSPQLERLQEAGWTCVPVGLDDTVEAAWSALAAMQGARYGR